MKKSGDKFICPNCGYERELNSSNNIRFVSEVKEKKKEVIVIDEKEQKELEKVYSRTIAECPKCGNREAYYWFLQTRRSDEPPTRFYRCTKCNYTWREYS